MDPRPSDAPRRGARLFVALIPPVTAGVPCLGCERLGQRLCAGRSGSQSLVDIDGRPIPTSSPPSLTPGSDQPRLIALCSCPSLSFWHWPRDSAQLICLVGSWLRVDRRVVRRLLVSSSATVVQSGALRLSGSCCIVSETALCVADLCAGCSVGFYPLWRYFFASLLTTPALASPVFCRCALVSPGMGCCWCGELSYPLGVRVRLPYGGGCSARGLLFEVRF